jgi:hypothetical protein
MLETMLLPSMAAIWLHDDGWAEINMDHTQLHSQSELVAVAVVLSQLQIVYH